MDDSNIVNGEPIKSREKNNHAKIKFEPVKQSAWAGLRESLERWLTLSEEWDWEKARKASNYWHKQREAENLEAKFAGKLPLEQQIKNLEASIERQEHEEGHRGQGSYDPNWRKKLADDRKRLEELMLKQVPE